MENYKKDLILPSHLEEIPLDQNGNPKLRFQVKLRKGKNGVEQAVFINGELLDWSADVASLSKAYRMGPEFYKAAQNDVVKHFIESVSEFIGRPITPSELQEATKSGWI